MCHRNIDPLGFALETFDPIGRARANYPKSKAQNEPAKIDTSGKLPSGETFSDVRQLKKVLAEHRRDLFTENLIKKLLEYATGRHMERSDQFEIDDILARVQADNYGLRTVVNEVFMSEIFRSR